ncbi:MAG: galactosyldiacylglycerol synthase [Opitutales bacterium]
MSRILILTAGYGEGHNAAARNLAAAFDRAQGPGTARIVDLFALGSPRMNAVCRRLYLAAINRTPRLWSAFYAWIDRARPFPRHLWLFRRELGVLAELLQTEAPEVICSTYPIYGFLLDRLAATERPRPLIYAIVTDSISINSLWWLPSGDGWFLPNADSAEVLLAAGRPMEQLHVCGFPVPAIFSARAGTLQPPNLAAGHAPRVLYIINSGSQDAEATAHLLLAQPEWEITCAVGRDHRLRRKLEEFAARRPAPAAILGWTDRIPELLMTHHAVVSKAGGATTQEALAARCPMIVNQIVPGQEEGNYELLRRHGIGARATTPREVVAALHRAFAGGGTVWREWRRALEPLAHPTAGDDIVRQVQADLARRAARAPALPVPTVVSRHG